MALDSIKEELLKKFSIGITWREFLLNLVIAIVLIIMGIVIGKLVKFGLRKGFEKIKIDKVIKPSFISLFLVIVKWSIYVLFIDFALIQLGIPEITNWLTTILGVLPALTGALIIISVGFAIGNYLKKVVVETKIINGQFLSQILFYFVSYIFMIFAFKTALISLKDQNIVNALLLIFTLLGGVALLIHYVKNPALKHRVCSGS